MSPAVQQIAADAASNCIGVSLAQFEDAMRRLSFVEIDRLTERLAVHPDGARHADWLATTLGLVVDTALGLQGEGS